MSPRATYAHPVALGALALLLVNDHVLKPLLPGPVTGKLSDVAGPVVAAALAGPLAVRLSRRPRAEAVAWWAVAVAFAAVKTVPVANAAAVSLLTALAGPSAIARDPYDVLGLLALPFAWRWTRSAPLRTPRWLRATAAAVACGAVTATSMAAQPAVSSVSVDGDEVVAVVVDDSGQHRAWRSADGRTWQRGAPLAPVSPPEPASPTEPTVASACHRQHCYRVGAGPAIEESTDGGDTWHVSATSGDDFPPDEPRAVVFVPGRDVAVVAVGEAGVLRRDGGGPWQSVRVGDAKPGQEDPGPLVPPVLLLLPFGGFALLVALTAGLVWLARRTVPADPVREPWTYGSAWPLPPPPPPPPRQGPGRYRRR